MIPRKYKVKFFDEQQKITYFIWIRLRFLNENLLNLLQIIYLICYIVQRMISFSIRLLTSVNHTKGNGNFNRIPILYFKQIDMYMPWFFSFAYLHVKEQLNLICRFLNSTIMSKMERMFYVENNLYLKLIDLV